MTSDTNHRIQEIASDVGRLRIGFVNCYFIGEPRRSTEAVTASPWVLVDAAVPGGASRLLEVAGERFGPDSRPSAIVLTHGHFDHVGALELLLGFWNVPVYAHALELPFLKGRADYPPPDPTVGRGIMTALSSMSPERGIDIGRHVRELPSNGDVPMAPGWRWVYTPGHAPGHVSLFRAKDHLLVAGDAVTTTRPESIFSNATQKPELNGPPAGFTFDWNAAHRSVSTLAMLKPTIVAAGHGPVMRGDEMPRRLAELARDFDKRARPRRGRYVREAAITDADGVVYVPPPARGGVPWAAVSGVAAAAVAGTWFVRRFGRRSKDLGPSK